MTVKETEIVPWLGRQQPIKGNLIYTESGWMSVHITGAVPRTISRGDFLKLPAEDRVVWLDAYYAYYGSFEIDEVAHVVTHHVANSLLPYETATMLKRNVAINGDILTLLTPPRDDGGGKTFNRLVWKKAA
ncbi:lipocalin-like domain-containing protein [Hyphomicrobiales bacterium BP6-180914]|uniref:Lipocalin-like domain-containing protein n=1 Tax=Lichenifustis flavocetrariae TaxID=2949735 RepID=A0AA41ZBU1_9HYPH|nr:lipocalin-like domain-containing protein [Lichenifustis flavocetrariae]